MTEATLHNEDPSVIEVAGRYYLINTQEELYDVLGAELRRAVDEGRVLPEDQDEHIEPELLRFIDAGIQPSSRVLVALVPFNTIQLENV